MKNWKKIALFTILILGVLLWGIFYVFNLKVTKTFSKDLEFSPANTFKNVIPDSLSEKPKNIIVFIADGLGFSHMSLAMMIQQEEEKPSVWEAFDVKGWHDARSTYGPLTDSGASATAMATGSPVFFDAIGVDPDGKTLTNVFELASANNYNTGIVTDSYIWDATPAAFVAHTKSRDNAKDILNQIASSELDLLFGELEDVGEDEVPDLETTLEILEGRFQLLNNSLELPITTDNLKPIAAIYKEDEVQDLNSSPNLTQLTEIGLKYLTSQDKPFMLLVECEEMDAASHKNASKRMIRGLQSLQKTLSFVFEFAKNNGETLVLLTSDHETGGLAVAADFGDYPNMQIIWSTKDHTASVVPILAHGPGARYFSDVDRNWQIGEILKNLISEQ